MKKFVILVTSISTISNTNSCAGATHPFLARGHRVIILLEETLRGKYSPLGFEECLYRKNPSTSNSTESDSTEQNVWLQALIDYKVIGPHPPEEKLIAFKKFYSNKTYHDEFARFNDAIYAAIEMCKPDLLVSLKSAFL